MINNANKVPSGGMAMAGIVSIKAAVCEDDPVQRRNIKHMLEKWSAGRGIKLLLSEYRGSESFLFDWDNKKDFDLLLLDIDLGGGMNGMDLAGHIRKWDQRTAIIFITGLAEYMSHGYDVQAFHFLVKPISEDRLFQILDKFSSAMEKKETFLLVKSETGTERISLDRILYVEAFSHTADLYMVPMDPDGKRVERKEINMGLKELEGKLPSPSFFRCHRSYLINLLYVRRICAKNEVVLDYAGPIPVSRSNEKGLYQAFLDFHRGENLHGNENQEE